MNFLEIRDLHVSAGGKEILKGVDLTVETGRTAIIFGPNGSGKSTLLGAIAGLPGFIITQGDILFKGMSIKDMPVDERSRMGIGMAFQYPPAVKGVRLETLLKNLSGDQDLVRSHADLLNMTSYLGRDINVGFSGGERKRSEILQLMIQMPDLLLLDEPESGVDIENISVIAHALRILLEKEKPISKRGRSAIMITHTGFILDYIKADIAFVIMDGHVLGCGAPGDIFDEIKTHGYKQCGTCFAEKYRDMCVEDL
ncbi:MAG TPA: ABC transporter ATP-binding protein [Deltaproteobacteria bacterium]|nr:ABC transporter ATP-binding protein [Deltaproteobacteria bacterium]HPR53545.1 ABC transporter ATP-binding protein [Deltaproteobacteria bacterium]HXK46118.1 ABC transporter ATP-binding protein [Deltaproteobacteria bacterium]